MTPRSIADDGTETKTEVDNRKVANLNVTLSHGSNAGNGTETKTKWRSLPQEMIFEILSRLPAQVIHDVMRRVCKEWKLMISSKDFIYNHLSNSTPGIVITERYQAFTGIYVEMGHNRLEICKFDCSDSDVCGSSVNGLVLVIPTGYKRARGSLSIINPLTKQREAVPCERHSTMEQATLALDEASMKYKAVRSFRPGVPPCISVLTIGVDNDWRDLDMKHISKRGKSDPLFDDPFPTPGYVHWFGHFTVLTLNVETEIIYEFRRDSKFLQFDILEMGRRNPSFYRLSKQPESRDYLMEVVEMDAETGKWTKLLSSDLKPLSDRFKGLKSVQVFGVLGGGEVFLFGFQKLCAAYNVRTREIQSFELETRAKDYRSIAHVKSMIWYK